MIRTDMRTDHDIHLVIPCYRESTRIPRFLETLVPELDALGCVSLMMVDDGSGAEEQARMHAIVEGHRSRHGFIRELLTLPQNLGKGGTVYAGWAAHAGEPWLMFADADGSVPATEIARIIRLARAEHEPNRAYFASRVKMLGRRVERVWYRDVMGQVFHWLVNAALKLQAHDTQCGCKLVPRQAFERARNSLSLFGFAFDLDLLLGLRSQGCDMTEVPVDWHEVPGGKLRLVGDTLRMVRDVLRLRAKDWKHPDPDTHHRTLDTSPRLQDTQP